MKTLFFCLSLWLPRSTTQHMPAYGILRYLLWFGIKKIGFYGFPVDSNTQNAAPR